MSLRERIEARLALAEAATPGPWGRTVRGWGYPPDDLLPVFSARNESDAHFIADRDPAAAVRECLADLALLDFIEDGAHPPSPWVDDFLANLSDRYPEGDA